MSASLSDFATYQIPSGNAWYMTGQNTVGATTTLQVNGWLYLLSSALTNHGSIIDTGTLVAQSVANTGIVQVSNGSFGVVTLTGNGTVEVGSGGHVQLYGPDYNTVDFTNSGTLSLLTSAASGARVLNFTAGDTISLSDVPFNTANSVAYNSGMHDIIVYSPSLTVLAGISAFNVTIAAGMELAQVSGSQTDIVEKPICFLRDTWIRTVDGDLPVQQLKPGDQVVTLSGAVRPILWIGTSRTRVKRGKRCPATPVIIRKAALAPNVPSRDLRVTKGHALYIDEVLIPVEFLVNHRSILWDDRAQEVEVYHVELETHDVLLANGAPAESYRDDGNRALFGNGASGPLREAPVPYAPLLTGGPVVDAIWHRLLDRAGPRPGLPTTPDADLHLMIDGERCDAEAVGDNTWRFRLTHLPNVARIVSRAAIPAELGIARDSRPLGVALRRITLRDGRCERALHASNVSLLIGFHMFEPLDGIRWTDGDALLPAALFEGMNGVCELLLELGGTTQYPLLADNGQCIAA